MSEEACAWAQGQKAGNRTAKFVLMRLAAYADAEGVAWAAVATLAGQIEADDRTVQRALRLLEKLKLLVRTGAFKGRNIPFYRLDLDGSARAAAEAAANGDSLSPLESGRTVTPVSANGDSGVTQKKEPTSSEGSSEPSSEGAGGRAGEVLAEGKWSICDRAFAAYPLAGRKGPSSLRLWRSAWASEVANGADQLAMLAAVIAYAADRAAWGSSGRPKTAHAWLGEGCWEAFAPEAGAVTLPASGALGWTGPAEVRAALAAQGEAFIGSYLNPARWDGAAVVAATGVGARKLREALKGRFEVKDPPGGNTAGAQG